MIKNKEVTEMAAKIVQFSDGTKLATEMARISDVMHVGSKTSVFGDKNGMNQQLSQIGYKSKNWRQKWWELATKMVGIRDSNVMTLFT